MPWSTPENYACGGVLNRTQLREYSRGTRVLLPTKHSGRPMGHPQHRQRCAAAATRLDDTQEVQILRLDARDQCLPGSVALDNRRELHTPISMRWDENTYTAGND